MVVGVRELQSGADLDRVLADSRERPQFIFKHSTRCPVSRWAYEEFTAFAAGCPEAGFAVVPVIESRQVSDAVAARLGVRHESPQVIMVVAGCAVWHASHYDAHRGAMAAALADLGPAVPGGSGGISR